MDPRFPLRAAAATLLCLTLASSSEASFHGFDPFDTGKTHPALANGRVNEVPSVEALALEGRKIHLDGKLDDPAWLDAEAAEGFRVSDPDRGAIPSEETVFKVAYDSDAVYFGVACLEHDPANISSHLARRDRFSNSDLVSIYLDPYHDRNTGYNFRVNPKGVLVDASLFNDGERDEDWDTIWQAETYRDAEGWYTEIRIPFSSIRFRPAETMTWGLQIYRYMHGRGEDTAWVIWDRETRGFISRFGTLTGLRNIPAPRRLEVLPYFLQSTTDPAGPAGDALDTIRNLGADLKYGVTSDLTLNAAIQPDFGQVEADPAVLNLSPFETYFEEQRPFFIEGSRFFQHPDFNLFYSRRIGTGEKDSRIRFAGKLTGKTSGDVSVALLAAATDVTPHGRGHNPFAGGSEDEYFVIGRFGREFDEGKQRFNLTATAVTKTSPRSDVGDFLSREAYTGGLDFDLNSGDRAYNLSGSVVGSAVAPEPIGGMPTTTRYGSGGTLELRKLGGNLHAGLFGRWESARLDLNDAGFLSAPDEISTGFWSSYDYNPEGSSRIFNRIQTNINLQGSWLFAGRKERDRETDAVVWSYGPGHRQDRSINANGWMQYRNYYETWWGIQYQGDGTRRYETRGGPLMTEPATVGGWWGGQTDTRKNFSLDGSGSYFRDRVRNASLSLGAGLRWNMSSALNHRLSLNYTHRTDDSQYLETVDLAERPGGAGIGGRSYVFGDIDQETLAFTLRTNLLFTRNQSLELYAQPFISVGSYADARELARPDSYDLVPYREAGFEVADNDFRFTSVNLNVVYRFEYRPGSTLFLVWAHSRSAFDRRSLHAADGRFDNTLSTGSLFDNEPENVVMAKLSYWFSI